MSAAVALISTSGIGRHAGHAITHGILLECADCDIDLKATFGEIAVLLGESRRPRRSQPPATSRNVVRFSGSTAASRWATGSRFAESRSAW